LSWALGAVRGWGVYGFTSGSPIFSADSNRMAYGAKTGQKVSMVVDGQAGPEFDVIVGISPARLVFDSAGTFAYLAVKDGVVYRVWHTRPAAVPANGPK
jgi:hypothetical protein